MLLNSAQLNQIFSTQCRSGHSVPSNHALRCLKLLKIFLGQGLCCHRRTIKYMQPVCQSRPYLSPGAGLQRTSICGTWKSSCIALKPLKTAVISGDPSRSPAYRVGLRIGHGCSFDGYSTRGCGAIVGSGNICRGSESLCRANIAGFSRRRRGTGRPCIRTDRNPAAR